jgi:hypothetical protein
LFSCGLGVEVEALADGEDYAPLGVCELAAVWRFLPSFLRYPQKE